MPPERCMEFVGGSVGCATFCTNVKGHVGPCESSATAQLLWNEIATLRRAVLTSVAASEDKEATDA